MKILIARIADSLERPGEVLSIEGRPATMVELHGPFDLREWRENVHRKEIDRCTGFRIRIDEVSIRIKFEDEKDRMDRNAGDMLLEFDAELRKGGDILDRRDLLKTDDGGGRFELGSGALYKSCVELTLVRG